MRINGKIRAREVRVIGPDGAQVGILPLSDALSMARTHGVDLVEIAPNATPPVCRVVDFGKYRYELAKKERADKSHQHASRLKEIQLTCSIDPHDLGVKLQHGIDFLCDENKVKLSLRFRGREMAHKEIGFQVVNKFISALGPYGHPDAPAKQIGRGITVMVSPLPRNKRAPNPNQTGQPLPTITREVQVAPHSAVQRPQQQPKPQPVTVGNNNQQGGSSNGGFVNNPFGKL